MIDDFLCQHQLPPDYRWNIVIASDDYGVMIFDENDTSHDETIVADSWGAPGTTIIELMDDTWAEFQRFIASEEHNNE